MAEIEQESKDRGYTAVKETGFAFLSLCLAIHSGHEKLQETRHSGKCPSDVVSDSVTDGGGDDAPPDAPRARHTRE